MTLLEIIGALTLLSVIIFAILFTLNILMLGRMPVLVEDDEGGSNWLYSGIRLLSWWGL